MRDYSRRFWAIVLTLVATSASFADQKTPGFNSDVRPLLKAYCTECHGEAEKPKGGLDLRLARFIRKGGVTGPGLVEGNAEKSLLIERVRSGEMPPGKKKLTTDQIDLLSRWITAGAKTEANEPTTLANGFQITPEDRQFWAFQPIRRSSVPKVDELVRTPVDAFLAAKLREKQMRFSPEADRLTLIRRVTFDLIGLPPTPAEIEAFLKDTDSHAYEKLVDRLLATPQYGERQARHWLDVAGYADSEGASPEDPVRTNAWKYRDYVIKSMNRDLPFDRFIQEQIAGDELATIPWKLDDPDFIEKMTATGFLRMAPDGSGAPGADAKLTRNAVVTETVKIISSALMGVTVGCAQCHNHRYDPIPQTDFYRMRAILEPGYDPVEWKAPAARQVSLYTDADRKKSAEVEAEAAKIDKIRLAKEQEFVDQTFAKEVAKLPESLREQAKVARATPEAKRTDAQKKLMQEHPSLIVSSGSLSLYDPGAIAQLKVYIDQANEIRKKKPVEEFVRALTDSPNKLPPTRLQHRGDPDQPKQVVEPGSLSVLDDVLPMPVPQKLGNGSSGRRLAFAKWVTDPKNPLTARVLANRVWMNHFGRGLIGTPGDLGRLGDRPTHPELLDWLASEFILSGWSLKQLHRVIMNSAAYRQSSVRIGKTDNDPDSRWLSRYPLRRLDAEAIRDAMLSVSGKLNLQQFGPPVPVMEDDAGLAVIGKENRDGAGYKLGDESVPAGQESRRSVYVQVRRTKPLIVLDVFDWATTEPNCEARKTSTATPQSLLLLNNEFALQQSNFFAERLQKEAGNDVRKQVTLGWRLAYAAEPSQLETDQAVAFVEAQQKLFETTPVLKSTTQTAPKGPLPPTPQSRALAVYCQALLLSNRFLYLD